MGTTQQGTITEQAWFPDVCTIKIERGDSTYNVQNITTEITNFSEGGGEKNIESIAHFGGAYLTVVKPQEMFEVSFDADITDTRWAQVMSDDVTAVGSGTSGSSVMVRSGGEQDNYKIKIEWKSSNGSEGYKIIYYNAKGVNFEKSNSADDRLMGTMSFQLSPASAVGSGQRYDIEGSDLTNTAIGSTTTGSYGGWEITADTLFGYGVGSML